MHQSAKLLNPNLTYPIAAAGFQPNDVADA